MKLPVKFSRAISSVNVILKATLRGSPRPPSSGSTRSKSARQIAQDDFSIFSSPRKLHIYIYDAPNYRVFSNLRLFHVYKTIILAVVLYGCETLTSDMKERA